MVNNLGIDSVFGEKWSTEEIHINDKDLTLTFDVYDGHAVSDTDGGHTYDLVYPTLSGVLSSERLLGMVEERFGIESYDEVEPIHSLQLFSTLYEDGKRVLLQ